MGMGKAKQSGRRSFTPAYKENAVGLAKELGNASAASRQLGISQSLLRSWIIASQLSQRSGLGLAAALEDKERMAKLERQVKALEEENAILKKATAYFAQGHLNRGTPSSKNTEKNGR
jgi:transposase